MSLSDWAKAGWLRPHQTSQQQIADLFAIVDRDLEDAAHGISPDWQFGIAYNAALKLCTILVYAEGWRPEKNLAHYRTLQALPLILGAARQSDADYLDTCRAKRNTAEYDAAGQVSTKEAKELAAFARELREDVIAWLEEETSQAFAVGEVVTHQLTGWRRDRPLFGKPDFAFPKFKLAVFVDGCFWHGPPSPRLRHGNLPDPRHLAPTKRGLLAQKDHRQPHPRSAFAKATARQAASSPAPSAPAAGVSFESGSTSWPANANPASSPASIGRSARPEHSPQTDTGISLQSSTDWATRLPCVPCFPWALGSISCRSGVS